MVDETAEKAEQEVIAKREAEMAAMRAAMEREEEEAARRRAGGWGTDGEGVGDAGGGEGTGMERALDEDVPEAGEVSFGMGVDLDAEDEEGVGGVNDDNDDDDDDGDDDDVDLDDDDGDETETLEETETAEVSVSRHRRSRSWHTDKTQSDDDLDESLQHERSQQGEQDHDLDNDIPEAGSYEHTDSELEDESSMQLPQSQSHHQTTIISSNSPAPPPPTQSAHVTRALLSPSPPRFSPQTSSSLPPHAEYSRINRTASAFPDLQLTSFAPPAHLIQPRQPSQSPVQRGVRARGDLRYGLTQSFIGTPALELDMQDGMEGESSLLVSSPIAARGGQSQGMGRRDEGGSGGRTRGLFTPGSGIGSWGRGGAAR